MANVPWHEEVVHFVQDLVDLIPDYEIACEHEHSNCLLIAHKRVSRARPALFRPLLLLSVSSLVVGASACLLPFLRRLQEALGVCVCNDVENKGRRNVGKH